MAVKNSYRIKRFESAIRFEFEVDDNSDSLRQQNSKDGIGCCQKGKNCNKNSDGLTNNIKDRVV